MTARPRKATAAVTQPDFASLLANAKLPESTVPVCLRADLVADHEAADRDLKKLLDRPSQKFSDGRAELRQRILDLEAEMEAATHQFRLRALPKPKWRALVAAHPPRQEADGSLVTRDGMGVNSDTFFGAMIRACTIDPVLTEDQWRELLGDTPEQAEALAAQGKAGEVEDGKLTDRQFDEISDAAWSLNRRDVDVPFSRAASRTMPSSELE